MMCSITHRRGFAAVIVGLVLMALTAPATADSVSDARQRQAETQAKRAQIAAQIDSARATNAQLEGAVRDLDAAVATQQASADAATQASEAADDALKTAQSNLTETRRRRDQLRQSLKDRVIAAYVNPSGQALAQLLSSHDINEATRKREFLDNVLGNARDDLEQLKGAESDLAQDTAALAKAQETAAARRRQSVARLVALRSARADQDRLRTALQARISAYVAEADAAAAEEQTLAAFIRSHTAPERTSRGGGSSSGPASAYGLIWPVDGTITSEFGMRWGRMHQGIDIAAAQGTPIHAAKAGTVIFSGTMSGYGYVEIVDHGGGFTTLYAHQSELGASVGQAVAQGEVIGYVGATGDATGPHLHFETRVDGVAQNPRNYLP